MTKKLDELKKKLQTKDQLVSDVNKSIAKMMEIAKLIKADADRINSERSDNENK